MARLEGMSTRRNDLLDLHYASVAGSLLGSGPQQAAQDAEPEAYEPRPSRIRRLVAAFRGRRAADASAETGRA